jgi:hypothetical protein
MRGKTTKRASEYSASCYGATTMTGIQYVTDDSFCTKRFLFVHLTLPWTVKILFSTFKAVLGTFTCLLCAFPITLWSQMQIKTLELL